LIVLSETPTPPDAVDPFEKLLSASGRPFNSPRVLYESGLRDQTALQQTVGAIYPARYHPWEEVQTSVAGDPAQALFSEESLAAHKHLLPQV